ncbi:hypothetical protein SAMN03159341_1062 [Paenibacillus sp. 1_12]|uniref:hypothetical protein n=1 Tax=Paenibacillus sp. 1_12 TaxID=1566278 RepID=UPI0008EA4039|nr:hypothetical protein [Paenibacillus sp. 1_12]SFL42599.1 hypothetical protein SAMN03159341_1062 [Paenibacillus sp. 1_12]
MVRVMLILILLMMSGCQQTVITEEKAISTVKEAHEKNSLCGEITITSVHHRNGEYEVNWERKSNFESGTEFVEDKKGKITHGSHQIS